MVAQHSLIVVTQWADGIVQIMHAEEYHRPDYNEMLSLVYGLISKYQIDKVYIDGANPSFIKSLNLHIGEEADYDKVIARYRAKGFGDAIKDMRIVHMYNYFITSIPISLLFAYYHQLQMYVDLSGS
jgi:hypothetical protein